MKQRGRLHIAKEIHAYGYHFSVKAHIFEILCILLGISAVGFLFQLKPMFFFIEVLAVVFVLPILILYMYKRMYEQQRFVDAVTYAEQVLYSFQKSKKIVSALKETAEAFEEGQMKAVLENAVAHMEMGYARTEKGILREGLEEIEKVYACDKIHMVHEFLIQSEEYGGDSNRSILIMLDDIEAWKRREYRLFADKKLSHADCIVSSVVATILCAITLYVMNYMGEMFQGNISTSMFQLKVIQISSLLFILFMLFIIAISEKSLTADWFIHSDPKAEKYLLSSYETIMNYSEEKEKKKSLLFAIPVLILSVIALYLQKIWLGVLGIGLSVLLLLQHRIGYRLAKKDVNRGLYLALPQWMMEMALLLQENNVQIALEKSIQESPLILKKELELLMERLREAPWKLKSYTDFCKCFDIPETQSLMKMLHAISEAGTGDAQLQIHNLLQRIHEMQNKADEIRNENAVFQMKIMFSYPIFGATVKLLVDLTAGMVFMIQILCNMGGM